MLSASLAPRVVTPAIGQQPSATGETQIPDEPRGRFAVTLDMRGLSIRIELFVCVGEPSIYCQSNALQSSRRLEHAALPAAAVGHSVCGHVLDASHRAAIDHSHG